MIRHIAQAESGRGSSQRQLGVGAELLRDDPTQPAVPFLRAGTQVVTGSFLVAYSGNQKQGGPKIRFPAVQVESTSFSSCTHTGVGPSVWDATHPRSRRCPALRRWQPPDLRPRKVVPASQAPCCQKSPSDPRATSGLCAHKRSAGRARGLSHYLPRSHPPAWHARPHPGSWGISPHVQEGLGAESADRRAGSADRHTGSTCPSATASPRSPAAAAMPAQPAPSPPPLPTTGSRLHSGSRARCSAGSKCHRHFQAAPRLRVPGATSAKACAPSGERRPGSSACWEL